LVGRIQKYSVNSGLWDEVETTIDLQDYTDISSVSIQLANGPQGLQGTDYGLIYVDGFRFYPSDAMMTTYTHDPLFGITSETAPTGVITNNNYDKLGKLYQVSDKDGIIHKRVEYHYSGQ
jgi:hypothetical protein